MMKRFFAAVLVLALLVCAAMPVSMAEEQLKYWIGVDVVNQRTTIYSTQDNSVVHQWICSTGKNSTPTPLGTHYLLPKAKKSERTEWYAFTGSYVKWAVRYEKGLFFHSILFRRKDDSSIMESSVKKLGKKASHGCIRLEVPNAKWISDNCPVGTRVIVHKGVDDSRITDVLGAPAQVIPTPEPTVAPTPTPMPGAIATAKVKLSSASRLSLRKKASTSASRVAYIPNGKQVDVLAVEGKWARVSYANKVGYVQMKYLAGMTDVVPTASPDVTLAPQETVAPTPVPTTEPTQTLQSTAEPEGDEIVLATVKLSTAKKLYIRKKCSTKAASYGYVRNGETVEIVESLNKWYRIRYNGMTGYVLKKYIQPQQ